MQRVLGIDLGTTNSVVARVTRNRPEIVPDPQHEESTPSVVAVGRRGDLLVGRPAKGQLLKGGDVVRSVKRFMGRRFATPEVTAALEHMSLPYRVSAGDDGDVNVWLGGRPYTPTEISSLVLGKLKADAESVTGLEFPRAVITVPAYFTERQVAATREAGRMAGFGVLKVLDEPTAAALAYGCLQASPDSDQTVLVFDLGGGTFDISVLLIGGGVFTVLCVEGDNLLGGDDFDELITQRVIAVGRDEYGSDLGAQAAHRFHIVAEAEKAKIELSAQRDTEIILPALGEPPVAVFHDLSREDLTELIRAKVDRAMQLVGKAVEGADLQFADVDQVLLVGGSTAIPYVQECIAALFGPEKIRKDVHPMKSVALGAAIAAGLVRDVECPACHASSPVDSDRCTGCGADLRPPPKVACPTCFLYADFSTDTAAACGKCGTPLAGPAGSVTGPTVGPDGVAAGRACPSCGGRLPDGGGECGHCAEAADPVADGVPCPFCSTLNPRGAEQCAGCGQARPVVMEITAQHRGIELEDGRMAVVLDKGTTFPTPGPVTREFVTSAEDQRRLEIPVYEGMDTDVAANNELVGYITLPLPPGLPRRSPVDVSFDLDDSRMLTIEVNVRAIGAPHRVEMQYSGRLDAESQKRLEAHRLKVVKFVDRWRDELSDAEAAVFFQLVEDLETMMVGSGGTRAGVDEITTRADGLVTRVSTIRGQDAFINNISVNAGKYLSEPDRELLAQFSDEIEEARSRADWTAAEAVGQRSRVFEQTLDRDLVALVFVRTWANQGKLSPALAHKAQGVLREVDAAYDRGDRPAVKAALAKVRALEAETWRDVQSRHQDVTAVSKLRSTDG